MGFSILDDGPHAQRGSARAGRKKIHHRVSTDCVDPQGMKRVPAAAPTSVSPRRKPGPIDTGLWNMIGVGRVDWFRSPSRRTGRAGLPHPALRSMVLPATGLTGLGMGVTQAVKPLLGKVGIGPPDVVAAAREARAAVAFAQDVPQASAYP